jgi:hypothetical protein
MIAPVTGTEREHDQQQPCRPSGVCGARLCDSRKIGSGDPRLQVLADGDRRFVVAPFDVLALRLESVGTPVVVRPTT